MPPKISQPVKWNAAAYAANSAVQQTWARELIAKLNLRGDERILDVGCGDGKVSAEIARVVPRGSVTGIDASAGMIAFAKRTFPAKENPNLKFQVCDAREIGLLFSPSPQREEGRDENSPNLNSRFEPLNPLTRRDATLSPTGREGRGEGEESTMLDVVFSNAALHWVDDHEAILRGVASVLKPGGRFIVSCGGKGNAHDVFLALRPEMRLARWRRFFRKMPMPYFFHSPAHYEKWLPQSGFKVNEIRLAPKDATYDGAKGFATWLNTTWIPYVQRVPENLREKFIAAVTDRYLAKHPPDAGGKVHVRMVRLEIDAVKI